MPTTIGRKVSSYIIVVDLMGSTQMPEGCDEKARSYGYFYDEVNAACYEHLNGHIRKASGDGVIITAYPERRFMDHELCVRFVEFGKRCNEIGREVGCKGTGS